MEIIIALLLMGNVESSLDLKSNEEYNSIKETIRVISVVNGIR
jgi:hypothetical protein